MNVGRTLAISTALVALHAARPALSAEGDPDGGTPPGGVFSCTSSHAGWASVIRLERDRTATVVAAKEGRRSSCQLRIVALKHSPKTARAHALIELALRPDSCEGSLSPADLDEVAQNFTVNIELRRSLPRSSAQWLRNEKGVNCEVHAWDEDAFAALAGG